MEAMADSEIFPRRARAYAGSVDLEKRAREVDLVRRAQSGDLAAFEALYRENVGRVYATCLRLCCDATLAEELTQDAFVRAWEKLASFRGDSAFSTWLYRIAVNACLNFRAARKPPADELPEGLADGGAPASERVLSEERARLVRAAVTRLPERQRATLILKVYHDLSHEEVARILGSTVGTVKANLFHALANLRRQVGVAPAVAGGVGK